MSRPLVLLALLQTRCVQDVPPDLSIFSSLCGSTTGMAAASAHATFSGSSLARLLWGLGVAGGTQLDADPDSSATPSFAERLGSWLDWTDAIALAAALDTGGALRPDQADADGSRWPAAAVAVFQAGKRVRDDLVKRVTADVAGTADTTGAAGDPRAAVDQAVDFAPYRRDYLAHQRAMESRIAPLRDQVRAALSERSPELARLAALDAVMEGALRPRERQVLATVPVWLERHFERLQRAGEATQAASAFHHRYQRDMQRVLLAELDLRLEPVEGLLQALSDETTREAMM